MMNSANTTNQGISCGFRNCKESCDDLLKLNAHIAIHLSYKADEILYDCDWQDCDFIANSLEELKRHAYYHGYYLNLLLQGKLACEQHSKIQLCQMPAREGQKLPQLNNNFQCFWEDCERSFHSIVEFQDHVEKHADFEYVFDKSPPCNWNACKKVFANKYRFVEHIRTHMQKKCLACFHCGNLFSTKTTLWNHLERQSKNNTQEHQCKQCFKHFATERILRIHAGGHATIHRCETCGKTFSKWNDLVTHTRYRHIKDRPFHCPMCNVRCVRNKDLRDHMTFKHSDTLHHCKHPGCEYSSRSTTKLRLHVANRHCDVPRKYACHICECIYKTGHSLSQHLIKLHDVRKLSCDKRFIYSLDKNGVYRVKNLDNQTMNKKAATSTITECESVAISDAANETDNVCELAITLPNPTSAVSPSTSSPKDVRVTCVLLKNILL